MVRFSVNLAVLLLGANACFAQSNCTRAAGTPMDMRVQLSIEDRTPGDRQDEKIGVAAADNDPSHHSDGTSHSNNFSTSMQIRVELQDSFGTRLEETAPNGEGKVTFKVCSRLEYRLRVTGAEIDEVTAENLQPGLGDRMVNLSLHLKSDKKQDKQGGGAVAANRLKIPRHAQKCLDKGNAALAAGKLPEARIAYEQAIGEYPQLDQAYNNLGVVLMKSGETARGKEAFEKAVEINEHFARALTNLARIAMDAKQYQDALGFVQKALASEPLNARTLLLGTESAFFAGKYSEAIGFARAVHALPHPGLGLAHFLCAESLEKQNLRDQAIAEYQMFLIEDPNDPNVPKAQMAIVELRASTP